MGFNSVFKGLMTPGLLSVLC